MRALAILFLTLAAPAVAWDAAGHRTVTHLALEGMRPDAPAWLTAPDMVARIADQSVVPDRWRSIKVSQLQHANNPDHYFDLEDLEPYEIKFADISPLRVEFIKQLMEVRCKKGWTRSPKPVNPSRDTDKTQEWPGFLPWAIAEQFGKVQSAMRVTRVLDKIDDPRRANQLEQARADLSVHMGILAHFVGDAAQPLHMTKHHHGWVGDNPSGYFTDSKFHSYIDGGVIRLHQIDAEAVRPRCRFTRVLDGRDPWPDILVYLQRSFDQVVPLYELKKSGELEKSPGKDFIESRLADAASMLQALYAAAWKASDPDQGDIDDFVRYDGFGR
jgi:hypothetical protein